MENVIERIDSLDLSLFKAILSQTSDEDKQSMLAVQRATANQRKHYAYLEIGSHLGGSIQPYLLDSRCDAIFSIDPRPLKQADDAFKGHEVKYENNSTTRMLNLLCSVAPGEISKIKCFDSDASVVDAACIDPRPHIAFIDGEHTFKAVMADFRFCRNVISSDGAIVFHDFGVISLAILAICECLDKNGTKYVPVKLGGRVFAIFFDKDTVRADPLLASYYAKAPNFVQVFRFKQSLKRWIPSLLWEGMKEIVSSFKRNRKH